MIGLFDSGKGGLNTVRYVKELDERVDLVYLIDRENAPYGPRGEGELVRISEENIDRLLDMGAERVLIACCTASTVYPLLKDNYRKLAVPIIKPIAKAAKNSTRSGRIGVIATKRTVTSHAFAKALGGCLVSECETGELVRLIDSGLSDKTVTRGDEKLIERMIVPVFKTSPDTLILGCTHFPALKKTIGRIAKKYGTESIIDSALIGAELIRREYEKLNEIKNDA